LQREQEQAPEEQMEEIAKNFSAMQMGVFLKRHE